MDPGLQVMMLMMPEQARADVAQYALGLRTEFQKKQYLGSMANSSVVAVCDHNGKLTKVEIREDMLCLEKKSLLEDLIPPAIEKAKDNVRAEMDQMMGQITDYANDLAKQHQKENCDDCPDKDGCHKDQSNNLN
jgi:DNA-binding protein YbaB